LDGEEDEDAYIEHSLYGRKEKNEDKQWSGIYSRLKGDYIKNIV